MTIPITERPPYPRTHCLASIEYLYIIELVLVLKIAFKLLSEFVVSINLHSTKKSLKIPKEQSESVNRRTDNTMTKRKNTKGQTTIYKTYT
jgi:hypothetical protein